MSNAFEDAATEIRAIFEQVRTDWTAYELLIEHDNRNVINLATQVNPFLCVSIVNLSGQQLDLGAKPRTRQFAQIQMAAAIKQGKGTAELDALLGFIAPYFNMKDLTTVRCQSIALMKDKLEKEWYYRPAVIGFYYIWE